MSRVLGSLLSTLLTTALAAWFAHAWGAPRWAVACVALLIFDGNANYFALKYRIKE